MRIMSAVFCVLLVLFAAVQYNDPDGVFWGVIYLVAAVWCGLAAFRPGTFELGLTRLLFFGSLALTLFGVVKFWPQTENFWQMDVWWETETAREGMGIMIVLLALIVAWLASRAQVRNG